MHQVVQSGIDCMNDAKELRDRASRLFVMAIQSRGRGDTGYADELTQAANEALAQAEAIERGATTPPSNTPEQSIGQQQQQPQSNDDESK